MSVHFSNLYGIFKTTKRFKSSPGRFTTCRAIFCNKKTPSYAGGSKKLIAMGLEKRTPFDYNKIAATNCKNNQKEVITK